MDALFFMESVVKLMRIKRRIILVVLLLVLFLLTVFIIDTFGLAKEKEYRGTLVEHEITLYMEDSA